MKGKGKALCGVRMMCEGRSRGLLCIVEGPENEAQQAAFNACLMFEIPFKRVIWQRIDEIRTLQLFLEEQSQREAIVYEGQNVNSYSC